MADENQSQDSGASLPTEETKELNDESEKGSVFP